MRKLRPEAAPATSPGRPPERQGLGAAEEWLGDRPAHGVLPGWHIGSRVQGPVPRVMTVLLAEKPIPVWAGVGARISRV